MAQNGKPFWQRAATTVKRGVYNVPIAFAPIAFASKARHRPYFDGPSLSGFVGCRWTIFFSSVSIHPLPGGLVPLRFFIVCCIAFFIGWVYGLAVCASKGCRLYFLGILHQYDADVHAPDRVPE
jgi:hypothetical protein